MSKILLYHGVTDWKKDPRDIGGCLNYNGKHIGVDEFEKQMKWLSENKKVVSLTNWIQYRPENNVAITFDDSYENLYHNAVPILKKYNLPATFFISTGFINKDDYRYYPTNRMYWTDMVDYYITYSNTDQYCLEGYDRVFNVESEEGKKEFAEVFKSYLKNCSPIRRITELKHFKSSFTAVGLDAKYSYPDIQNLSWEQIKEIDENPLFEIGGHTHNHEIMSYLTEKELSSEIGVCLELLSKELDRDITLFSYPEGQEHHYNKMVIDKLKENGIVICPSAINGDNDGQLNNFNLKRIMVGFNDTPFPYKEYYDESNS